MKFRKASYLPFMSCFPVHHINPFLLQRKTHILPITQAVLFKNSNMQAPLLHYKAKASAIKSLKLKTNIKEKLNSLLITKILTVPSCMSRQLPHHDLQNID